MNEKKRLTSSRLNSTFRFKGTDYSDYIADTRTIIEQARVDLDNLSPHDIQQIVDANAPAEYRPTSDARHGILLIHGMNSSPSGMSSLLSYYGERGYLVRSLLLPGHGTRPGDLLDVTYHDWLKACRFGIQSLKKEVEHVSVIAFSAGTALALYLALTETLIDSLVICAPALSLKNPFSSPLAASLYPLRNLSPIFNWPILKEEKDYAKYQSMSLNPVYQITRVMKLIQQISHPLTIPLYMVSTTDDETISYHKAIHFFAKQTHPLNRGIIYTNMDIPGKNHPTHPALILRNSYYPKQRILDFSHTALAISPDHPHYGKEGDYADFIHYNTKQLQNINKAELYYGSTSSQNLKKHAIQRLSYNPDFDFLAADIDAFLKHCADA